MNNTSFTHGGARLAVTRWGSSGVPLIALHAGVTDSRSWQWCAPQWADAGHRVIAYDRRGYGDTSHVAETHDDLDDLRAVAEATDARPAILVGNSRGGGLAIDLALARPDEVLGLVLIGPSPTGYPQAAWVESEAESDQDRLIVAAEQSGDLERVNQLEVRYWLDGTEQPEGRVVGPARTLMEEMNLRALRARPVGPTAEPTPAWTRIHEISAPVLVVLGEHDLPGVATLCRELVERLGRSRLVTIEGSAHCPSLDQPDRLNRAVIEFLGSLDHGRRS